MTAWHVVQFKTFLLILFRISGLFVTSPFFGAAVTPKTHKAILAFILALMLFPVLTVTPVALPDSAGAYVLACLSELAVGLILGFAMLMLLIAFQFAGTVMGREMGLSLANVIDPLSQQQVSAVGQLHFLFAIMVYLSIDGHHQLFGALVRSFDAIPLAGFQFSPELAELVGVGLVTDMFLIAVKLSAPVAVAVFMTTVAMGFLAKAVPEMNLFIVGFSVRILLGLMGIIVVLPLVALALVKWFGNWMRALDELVRLMGSG